MARAMDSDLDWFFQIGERGLKPGLCCVGSAPEIPEHIPKHRSVHMDGRVEHDDKIDKGRRQARKYDAGLFRSNYSFSSSLEPITCISPRGTHLLSVLSSGITWVGVHGIDSICVVTMVGDLDFKRTCNTIALHFSYEKAFHWFRKSIISYMEDLADPPTNTFSPRFEKPFGVVAASSLIPDPHEVHKDIVHMPPSDERLKKMWMYILYGTAKEGREWPAAVCGPKKATDAKPDEQKAIKFLQEKIESGSAFTVDQTIQTAISGFQHLFRKKFKADEIEVAVVDPNYRVSIYEGHLKDFLLKELNTSEIEYHLAAMDNPESRAGGSVSGSSWAPRSPIIVAQ